MEKIKILIVDGIHPVFIEKVVGRDMEVVDGTLLSREEIIKEIGNYDGVVIRSRIIMDREVLEAASHLKFIARAGAGMESIDEAYAREKGVLCLNAPE